MTKSHDVHSLSYTKWNCKYHIVFALKYRRNVFFGQKRYEIGKILRESYFCSYKRLHSRRNKRNAGVKPLLAHHHALDRKHGILPEAT